MIQFVYTLIQDHAVWQNLQFWEADFFNDVQNGIKDLYLVIQDQGRGPDWYCVRVRGVRPRLHHEMVLYLEGNIEIERRGNVQK